MNRRRQTAGFSLVEVVLALGVAAFALMAVLGLLSVAINSGKEASDDTLLVNMSNDLMTTWRGMPFAEIPLVSNPAAANLPVGGSPVAVTTETYFDENGVRLVDATGRDLGKPAALAAGAIYKCSAKIQGDAQTVSGSQVNLLRIELLFQWPAVANVPPHQKTVHASIARF